MHGIIDAEFLWYTACRRKIYDVQNVNVLLGNLNADVIGSSSQPDTWL